jgi:integrase
MPKVLMTDRAVAGLRSTTRKTYFDRKTTGLVLRVNPKTKAWYFVYRNGSEPEWLKLGTYPAVSLGDARKEANEQRALLDKGVDPVAEWERRTRPVEPEPAPKAFTFSDFVPTFIAFQKGRTSTWRDDENKIHRYLLPAWGALPLREIKRPQVHELLDTIAGQGLTIGVNRVQAVISRMFTVALDRSLIDAHPVARLIKRFKEQPRDRVLTDDELGALWAGLDAQPGAASDALRLRLLLAQRGKETAGLCWSELDLETAIWTLPRPRTKTKQRPHVIALPATALALLKRRREIVTEDEPRVFPGLVLTGDEHQSLGVIHGGGYTWKDLRRTVATRLADLRFDETVIGRLLNHAKYSITSKHYNQHAYLEEIRHALTAWDAELARILANKPRERSRVVPMRRRR